MYIVWGGLFNFNLRYKRIGCLPDAYSAVDAEMSFITISGKKTTEELLLKTFLCFNSFALYFECLSIFFDTAKLS